MRSCREPFGADLNHSTISSWVIFAILGPPSALRSPHAANRFIGLAIGVRTRSCALRSWVAAPVTIQGGYRPSAGNCRTPVSDSDPIETGRWLRTDIKALYCSHQNNDDSKCEAAHASLPDWPL